MKAFMRLKDVSVTDKKEKIKVKKLAAKLAGEDIDLEEVFKEDPKKTVDDEEPF